MADRIDREAALAQCKRHYDCTAWSIADGIEAIPAADVAQMRHGRWIDHYRSGTAVSEGCVSSCCDMRCQECKHGKTFRNMFGIGGFKCELLCVDLSPEAFCSYGERRQTVTKKRTKVYIAGPITGVEDYRERFAEAERRLTAQGYIALNPAILPDGMATADYMRICLAMLDTADAVAMLPGWGKSVGAGIEHTLARYTGKKIITEKSPVR